jgi:hypothetical protein
LINPRDVNIELGNIALQDKTAMDKLYRLVPDKREEIKKIADLMAKSGLVELNEQEQSELKELGKVKLKKVFYRNLRIDDLKKRMTLSYCNPKKADALAVDE